MKPNTIKPKSDYAFPKSDRYAKSYGVFCPHCGKKLAESIDGSFLFRCPRCKSVLEGRTIMGHENYEVVAVRVGVSQKDS